MELDCLYHLTRVLNEPGLGQDEVLQASVECIPRGWRHVSGARIVCGGREYRSPDYRETDRHEHAELVAEGRSVGWIDLFLPEPPSTTGEGPSQRSLLETVAEHLGGYLERSRTRETLELNEARLNSLLQLFQRSVDLDEREIIQYALEEAVKLTFSAIGYCHLVHDDQSSIELVTWSKKTLEICDAVHDTHYPISRAGVWADCARNRAPVIHNDYAGLAEKKGLPDGHAELVRHLSVPVVEGPTVSVIMGVGNKAEPYDESDVRQLQLLANDTWQIVRRKRVENQLHVMATTDSLTRLANRRYLFDRGSQELQRIERYGGRLSALLVDIDSFKQINDSHGHDVGDAVLRDLSAAMRASLRDVDLIGRVGGEEFAVLLPNTSPDEARSLAERLAGEVRRLRFRASGSEFGITVSIGLAAYDAGMGSFDALLKAADIALYGAKRSGRDCVYG